MRLMAHGPSLRAARQAARSPRPTALRQDAGRLVALVVAMNDLVTQPRAHVVPSHQRTKPPAPRREGRPARAAPRPPARRPRPPPGREPRRRGPARSSRRGPAAPVKSESSARVRQGMKNGEERYLLARDKGPVRRFIARLRRQPVLLRRADHPAADRHDGARLLGQRAGSELGNAILFGSMLLVIVDMLMLRFRLRRQLAARFPDESIKGTTYYAITRAHADEVHAAAQAPGQDRSRTSPSTTDEPPMTPR